MPGYPDRCHHIKINGVQCGSPALRGKRFCFFHQRFQDERIRLAWAKEKDNARAKNKENHKKENGKENGRAHRTSNSSSGNSSSENRPATFTLPVLEDANSIQIALMQVMRLLLSRQIEHKTASLLLYALQTASANLSRTQFAPSKHDIVLDPGDAAITPLDYRAWEDHEFQNAGEDDEEEQEANEIIEHAKKAAASEKAAPEKAVPPKVMTNAASSVSSFYERRHTCPAIFANESGQTSIRARSTQG